MERIVVGATRREKDEDLGGVNRDGYANAEYADFGVPAQVRLARMRRGRGGGEMSLVLKII
jgi:hypothetical protein